jgi:hypothetical protein
MHLYEREYCTSELPSAAAKQHPQLTCVRIACIYLFFFKHPQLTCVTMSKLGQKVTLQGIEPGSLL